MEKYSVDRSWVQKVSTAITTRDGVLLKECLMNGVNGESATLRDGSEASVRGLLDQLYKEVSQQVDLNPVPSVVGLAASPATDANAAIEEERRHGIETAVRVAMTGALAIYQKSNRIYFEVESFEMETEALTEEEKIQRTYHNTLLRGMLFAFEAFQKVHSMGREHYPPRRGVKTKGTVGWDTLVLLYFVHFIPKIVREASGSVVDDVTGEVVRQWRKLLIAVQNADSQEAPEHSRRRGTLSIVNGLLMILFSRYNTHQCNVLMNAVDHAERSAARDASKSVLQASKHMTSEMLTYLYFKGRLDLYGHRFEEALGSLRRAYSLLPPFIESSPSQCRNKFRVRFYLCIAAIINGRKIPEAILTEDGIMQPMMLPLIQSIQRGDPIAFHMALESFSSTFRRRGVYIVLQQCKHLCFLMLLARVHSIMGSCGFDNSRVPLAALVAAQRVVILEGSQENSFLPIKKKKYDEILALHRVDEDTMALSLSHLISRGWVRGYLSYEHKTLVLSKTLPFPTL